jgi:hypothetical protein
MKLHTVYLFFILPSTYFPHSSGNIDVPPVFKARNSFLPHIKQVKPKTLMANKLVLRYEAV